jgi:hypothetical protein
VADHEGLMPDPGHLLSELDKRYGFPTAGLAVGSFAAFLLSLREGFHFTNRGMMVAATLFFLACALYSWHQRDQSGVSYFGEVETIAQRLWMFPWRSAFAALFFLLLASLFGFLALTGWVSPSPHRPGVVYLRTILARDRG